MTDWLLDTNVLSELRRPKPEPKVLAFVSAQPLERLIVSTETFAEIRFGIELLSDLHRRAELTDWLNHKLRPTFEQRTLAIIEMEKYFEKDHAALHDTNDWLRQSRERDPTYVRKSDNVRESGL